MGKPSAPKAPDPVATAGAQTASNISTAIGQQQLNMVDQIGPQGSVTYDKTGSYKFKDPSTGKVYRLPQMSQTTTLSPAQQRIFDTNTKTSQNLSTLAADQSARLGGLLKTPFSLDNSAVEGRLDALASKRLNPQLEQQRTALETRLAGQGIKLGSSAYDRAMDDLGKTQNDARNQLLLTGHSQAVQDLLTERNQPLNEIIGLASGTQVGMPSYASTPQTGLAGTDVAGITQNAFANNQANYQSQLGQWNSTVGGLFGLGSAALMASDKRLKDNIEATGEKVAGVPVKTWTWKHNGEPAVGVIAQDLEKKHPELVDNSHPSGFKRVNYGGLMRLGASAMREAA